MASGLATWKPNKQQNHKGFGGGIVGVCFCLLLLILKKERLTHTFEREKKP